MMVKQLIIAMTETNDKGVPPHATEGSTFVAFGGPAPKNSLRDDVSMMKKRTAAPKGSLLTNSCKEDEH